MQHVILFCFVIVMSKQKRILSFFGRENKREQHRLQTETCRSDNVEEDKLSDTDECEPFVEPKAKAAKRNFQSTWLEKYKWLRYNNTKGMLCLICIESSKANPFTSGCITFITSTLTRHTESQEHQNALEEVHMISNFERAVVNSVALQEKALVSALKTVYWLGKENIATQK